MTTPLRATFTLGVFLSAAGLALAQEVPAAPQDTKPAAAPEGVMSTGRPITIQYLRPQDQRGINMFETTKEPGVDYKGFRVDFGAAFTAQFQGLRHENAAQPVVVSG